MEISELSVYFIIAWEVSAGDLRAIKEGYHRYRHPTHPSANSGLTIGIGYDLRYQTASFDADWRSRLPEEHFERLRRYLGKKGTSKMVRKTRDIVIPWADALAVFRNHTLPDTCTETLRVFPGIERFNRDIRGMLVDLVYNRGGSDGSGARAESWAAIRAAIAAEDAQAIADTLRGMAAQHSLQNLKDRREAEAKFVERSLGERGGPNHRYGMGQAIQPD